MLLTFLSFLYYRPYTARTSQRHRVKNKPNRLRLHLENLESRLAPDAGQPLAALPLQPELLQPYLVAGDPSGAPADSPGNRVDANSTGSVFAGVGSLFMQIGRFNGYIGSGTLIHPQYVLTAAHNLDSHNDGQIDFKPNKVSFFLNYGGDLTHQIRASELFIHPDFDGFNNPVGTVNDDIAIVKLSTPVPAGVPIYGLSNSAVSLGTILTMVGYGQSGDGVNGYTVGPDFSVKRVGANVVDNKLVDDEGSGSLEIFRFDFDGPTGTGPLGGSTLGNDVETTIGGGDSGGPSFARDGNGNYLIVGVNTFGEQYTVNSPEAPLFGSGGGGILVQPYIGWITDILNGTNDGGDGGDGSDGGPGNGRGKGKGGGPKNRSGEMEIIMDGQPDMETPERPVLLIVRVSGSNAALVNQNVPLRFLQQEPIIAQAASNATEPSRAIGISTGRLVYLNPVEDEEESQDPTDEPDNRQERVMPAQPRRVDPDNPSERQNPLPAELPLLPNAPAENDDPMPIVSDVPIDTVDEYFQVDEVNEYGGVYEAAGASTLVFVLGGGCGNTWSRRARKKKRFSSGVGVFI